MVCPGCSRKLRASLENRVVLTSDQEHIWGLCPYCNEIIHFLYTREDNHAYAWTAKQERKYGSLFEVLKGIESLLYIPELENPDSLGAVGRKFLQTHRGRVGFVITEEYRLQAKSLARVHRTVLLPSGLFPDKPSFIAEKLILDHVTGRLYATSATFGTEFELYVPGDGS